MITIRTFEPGDAAAVSDVIRTTMRVSNSADYPMERLQPLIDYFSPEKVLQLSAERDCLVAEIDGQIVGTAALEGMELVTFFVLPDHQRMGIGVRLLQTLEARAAARGVTRIIVEASVTGAPFYKKMGYQATGATKAGTAGPQIVMEKMLA